MYGKTTKIALKLFFMVLFAPKVLKVVIFRKKLHTKFLKFDF